MKLENGTLVHVVTTCGQQLIGVVEHDERDAAGNGLLVLEKAYSYNVMATPNGLQRIVNPAWLLEGSERLQTMVSTATEIRKDSVEFLDMMKQAEQTRVSVRAQASGIVPGRA